MGNENGIFSRCRLHDALPNNRVSVCVNQDPFRLVRFRLNPFFEQRATSNEQRANSKEQRAKSKEQSAKEICYDRKVLVIVLRFIIIIFFSYDGYDLHRTQKEDCTVHTLTGS